MEYKTIEMATLGRIMHPGTLYDCRSDSIIPGTSLWDDETMNKGLNSYRQPKTDLNISASDSLNEKAKLLEVSASLKASFLGGLVEVGGSAKYLRDNKSSARQSRVSLQYSQTTKFEQLTMDQMGNITYPEVFEDGTATHVVTAVLYGAQAFMVFDLTASENEDTEEIEGNLNVMIQKIPSLSVAGEGALIMTETEKKLANAIKCTFYGDYELKENPTTYQDALELYKTLPTLLRERENDAVPMKVWLYPLARLGEKAATLEREIHKTLISNAETLLEELVNAETLCTDLITNTTIKDLQEVKLKLKKFQKILDSYKEMFLNALHRLIPAIRGGKEQENALADIITIHQKSPFRAEKLNQWLENSQGEVNLLKLYIQELDGVPVVKYSALNDILQHPNVDTVVCFCFTSLTDEDPYLSMLTNFLKVQEFEKLSAIPEAAGQDIDVWFHNPEVIKNLKENFLIFKGFFQANKDDPKIRFVIVSVSDPSNPGISIRLYKKEEMVESAFKPVSKPPAPKVAVRDKNVILTLQKSPTGSTVGFRVEYSIIQATDSEADVENWEVTDTPDAQENFTLTGLQLTKRYKIRYRAISEVGVSEASDSVLFSAHGLYKLTLSQQWDWVHSTFITELRHEVMKSLGTSQWSPSTIKPVVKNLVNNLEIPNEVGIARIFKLLGKGMALHFQGVVPEDSDCFAFIFKTGKEEGDDIAFYLTIYPEKASYQRIFINGNWDEKEWIVGCPLLKGSAFDIFIVIENESYVVYLNGWRYSLFKHYIPVDMLTTLNIEGDVTVNSIGVVSVSQILKAPISFKRVKQELCRALADQEFKHPQLRIGDILCVFLIHKYTSYFIRTGAHLPLVTSKALVPHVGNFQKTNQTGHNQSAHLFVINYKTGPKDSDDIAFHFKVDLHGVVCNSCRNGKWGDEELTKEALFAKGEGFDIIMIIKPNAYEVTVNGRELIALFHRMTVSNVSHIQIRGDVLMNTCAIIHVDKINLTCDLSAHN